MGKIIDMIKNIKIDDKLMFGGMFATLAVWWIFVGRKRYGTKGASKYGR